MSNVNWKSWTFYDYKSAFTTSIRELMYLNTYTQNEKNPSILNIFNNKVGSFVNDNYFLLHQVEKLLHESSFAVAQDCVNHNSTELIDIQKAVITCEYASMFSQIDTKEKLLACNNYKLLDHIEHVQTSEYVPAPLVYKFDNKYFIIDGNCRYTIAKALGMQIKAQVMSNSCAIVKRLLLPIQFNGLPELALQAKQMFLDK